MPFPPGTSEPEDNQFVRSQLQGIESKDEQGDASSNCAAVYQIDDNSQKLSKSFPERAQLESVNSS